MPALETNSTLVGDQADHRRYHVTGILGHGGFGTVYRARMEGAGGFRKDVALKILRDPNPPPDVLSRFRDEARILGLVRHPHVVGVDPPVRLGGRWAVVMELVDGASCDELLARGLFPPSVVLELGAVVAQTLFDLYHATDPDGRPLHVVHRDLKPSNVQLTPAGHVKLLDFGIARAEFDRRETSTVTQIGGTPGYIAPERLDGVEGHEGDVWSLGVLLHRLVTGQKPPAFGEPEPADPEQRAALAALLRDPAVAAVVEYAKTLRVVDHRVRPTGDRVATDLRGLRARVGGSGLREWCRAHVPDVPARAPDELVGRTLSETISRMRPAAGAASRAPWLVLGLGGAVGGAVAFAFAVLAIGLMLALSMRQPDDPALDEPTIADVPIAAPAPAPLPPEPAPVEPAAAPAPVAPAPVTPAPGPRPKPAPRDPGDVGTVVVTGDATRVALRCAGVTVSPGPAVPAGTCTILATFGTAEPTPAGTVTVPEGGTVTLSCSASFQRCRAR